MISQGKEALSFPFFFFSVSLYADHLPLPIHPPTHLPTHLYCPLIFEASRGFITFSNHPITGFFIPPPPSAGLTAGCVCR